MANPFYTYILNIYDLVGFYGISNIVGYLMPNPLYKGILNIYDLDWFGLVYGISTIVGYFMPNPFIRYILNIWFLNTFRGEHFLTNLSSFFHAVKWFHLFLSNTNNSINFQSFFFFCSQFNVFKYCNVQLTIPDIGIMVRVFANGPGDLSSIPGRVIPKTLKMVLDASLLNTQHYKVRINGNVEKSWERSSALPYTLV